MRTECVRAAEIASIFLRRQQPAHRAQRHLRPGAFVQVINQKLQREFNESNGQGQPNILLQKISDETGDKRCQQTPAKALEHTAQARFANDFGGLRFRFGGVHARRLRQIEVGENLRVCPTLQNASERRDAPRHHLAAQHPGLALAGQERPNLATGRQGGLA